MPSDTKFIRVRGRVVPIKKKASDANKLHQRTLKEVQKNATIPQKVAGAVGGGFIGGTIGTVLGALAGGAGEAVVRKLGKARGSRLGAYAFLAGISSGAALGLGLGADFGVKTANLSESSYFAARRKLKKKK